MNFSKIRHDSKNMTMLSFDLDVHNPKSFLHYFLKTYLQSTYDSLSKSNVTLSGKTILDIGIGRGRALSIFKKLKVKKVIGIDINSKETIYAKEKANELNLALEIILDKNDNSYLNSIEDESYEIISIMYTLFCLPSDTIRENIINQVKRILKPKGFLILMDSQKYSMISYLNGIINTRKFVTKEEMLSNFKPLKLISWEECDYFYFFNKPMDFIGQIFGSKIYKLLDNLSRKIKLPGSMIIAIFKK